MKHRQNHPRKRKASTLNDKIYVVGKKMVLKRVHVLITRNLNILLYLKKKTLQM